MQIGWDGMLLQDAVVAMLVQCAFYFEKKIVSATRTLSVIHLGSNLRCC